MRIRRQRNAALTACMVVVATVGLGGCASSHDNRATAPTSATATPRSLSTSAPAATTVAVPVKLCAQQAGDNESGVAQPPASVSDLRGVQFDQSGMGFFGVPLVGAAQTVLGQADASCGYAVGNDGSTYITVTGTDMSLYETYLPGGIEIIAEDLCGAFPQAASTVNGQLANAGGAAICPTSGSSAVRALSSGLPISGLYIGIKEASPGSDSYLAQQLPASIHDKTWQLDFGNTHVVMTDGGTSLDFKSLACAAAPADAELCTASFEYFVSGLVTQAGYGRPDLSALYRAIAAQLG